MLFRSEKLEVKRLKAELSSASKCTIKVEEELSFNISSGSRLNYSGQPVMSGMNVSGGAKVKQLK